MLLWSGQAASTTGSQVTQVALPLLILALTHSPVQASIVSGLGFLPYLLFSLPAGALVDRWNRKVVMMLCDAGRALNMSTVPLALLLGHLTMGQLYVVATVEGTLLVFFTVSEAACLTRLVPQEQLPQAAGQNEAIWGLSALCGPPLAGVLYQTLGRAIPFAFDAVSYAASVVSIGFIRTRFQDACERDGTPILADVQEGVLWLWRSLLRRVGEFGPPINVRGRG